MLMSLINMQAASIGAIVMAFPPIFESVLMLIGMLDDRAADRLAGDARLAGRACRSSTRRSALYGTRIVPRIRRVQSLELRSLSIVFEAMSMLRVIVSFGRERLEHYRFRTQGRTAVDARVRLTVQQTLFSLGVDDRDRARHRARARLRRLRTCSSGEITLGELIVLISYIAVGLPAARGDQPDDRAPAPAASCS